MPIREADGSIIWHGFVADVTERKRGEEALRFQHALLRSQSEAAPDGILIVGPDNTVLSFNQQFLSVWDIPVELLSSKDDEPVLELAKKRTADPEAILAGVAAIYADRNVSSQHEVYLADGRVLDRYSTPIRGENKEYLGRVWYFRDITDRKKAEVSLRESRERYRQLINSLPEAVFISSGGRIVFCNPACLRLLGATRPAEILGRKPFELVHPDQQDRVRERHASLIETGESVPGIEIKVVRLDGRPVSVYAVAIPILDRGENAILVAISDLTDRERSMAMLGSVWDSVNDAIITCDQHARIQSVNRATTTLFGYAVSELLENHLRHLMPAPYQQKCEDYFSNYIRTGAARMIGIGREVVGLKKDGTTFPCELTVTEFRLNGERHFTGVIRDITARKQLEEQFHQAQKLDAFGQLAGGVAHDFNNLLTVINGYSHILHADIPASDPRKEYVESIQKAGQQAAGLTAQLLAFSRKTIIAPKVLDLNELIEHLLKMLRRLIGEDVSFDTVFAPGNLKIKIDPSQCEQVFINLAVNARDAMPRGGCLTFETSHFKLEPGNPLAQKLQPGSYVRACVSDTGLGISPDVLSRIFEPFFTTKEVGRGTGLGLATVYGIVMQAGGNISVESELGKGTKFTILFPAINEPEATGQQFATEEFAPTGTETILLVEDEEAVLKLTRKLLESQGYRVIPTSSGPAALAALQNHMGEIDLLLTDVVLSGVSGRELAEEVRARKPSVRVLYMTGYTGDAVLRYGVETATDSLIQKPFTSLALARQVRETLDSATAKSS